MSVPIKIEGTVRYIVSPYNTDSDLILRIGNNAVPFIIDTGAVDNMISLQLLQTMNCERLMIPTARQIILINGTTIPVVGKAILHTKFQGNLIH